MRGKKEKEEATAMEGAAEGGNNGAAGSRVLGKKKNIKLHVQPH